jgi:hypothetical protein
MKLFLALAGLGATLACGGGGGGPKALDPAVFGTAVAPPDELGKLAIGMPVEEARKVAPKIVPKEDVAWFKSPYKGMSYLVGLDDKATKIDRLHLQAPLAAREMMVQAWGPGQAATCTSGPCIYWFVPERGARVQLETSGADKVAVEFDSYLPVAKLPAAGKPATFSFETGPLLGQTPEEIRAAYPDLYHEERGNAWLHVLATEYDSPWTSVSLTKRGSRVSAMRMDLPFRENPAAKDGFVAAFEAAWGKGTQVKDDTVWLDPAAKRRAKLSASDTHITVIAETYFPLDAFLGEGPDKLGFETTPLLGAAWADVEAAYKDYIETAPTAGKPAELELPGVDTGHEVAMKLYLDDAQKVSAIEYVIPHGYDAARIAAIRAGLDKKYGPGKDVDEYGFKSVVFRAADPRIVGEGEGPYRSGWKIVIGTPPEK